MPQLNALQVAAVAYAGGFRGNDITEAVAVAYGESGWSTTARNFCCVGLWQINLKAHGKKESDMIDPVKNSQTAFDVFKKAGGWCAHGSPSNHTCNPWQAYGNSSYHAKLGEAQKANLQLQGLIASKGIDVITQLTGASKNDIGLGAVKNTASELGGNATLNPIAPIVEILNRIGSWLNPANIYRIVKVSAGILVVIGGALILARGEINSVVKATPIGRVLK